MGLYIYHDSEASCSSSCACQCILLLEPSNCTGERAFIWLANGLLVPLGVYLACDITTDAHIVFVFLRGNLCPECKSTPIILQHKALIYVLDSRETETASKRHEKKSIVFLSQHKKLGKGGYQPYVQRKLPTARGLNVASASTVLPVFTRSCI